ncbi:MAG: SMC-Scp complex subunit ScpB, partial [Christensenellaceae bacterium]
VSAVLNPIKEKEFTKTILECAAIIAYKQPITKAELEAIRGVSSDYAIRTLLELEMIEVQGRKDAVGKPILYGTTDNFLKRFRLTSLEELPDYETLMQSIHLSNDEETYLYAKEDFDPAASTEEENKEELPDFLKDLGEEALIRIGTDDEAS